MKIHEIEIRNFRSINSLQISIRENFLQIIGENNSGKTNILLALKQFFSKTVRGMSQKDFFMEELENDIKISVSFNDLTSNELDFFEDYVIDEILKIEKIFSIDEDTKSISSSYYLCQKIPDIEYFKDSIFSSWSENKPKIDEWIKKNGYNSYFYNEKGNLTKKKFEEGIPQFIEEKGGEFENWTEKQCKDPFSWKLIYRHLPKILYIQATKKVSEETAITSRSKSIYKKIIEKIILKTIKDKDEILNDFRNGMKIVKEKLNKLEEKDVRFQIIKETEKELLENLNKNINTNKLEIKFITPTLKDFFSNSEIFINDGIHSSVEFKGDGLKRSLIFALFITYSNFLRREMEKEDSSEYSPFIFLIEEPELYMHPQAQKELSKTLFDISKFDQIFYTTHSPYFIDIEKYLSLILVRKTDIQEGTKIDFIEEELFESNSKKEFNMLMRFNPERNEMFFAKKIVLVEGDVEKIIINGVSELMEKDFNKFNISLIECSGKTNLLYFIKMLSQFNKPIILIHDIDPLSAEEQKDIEELRNERYINKDIEKIKSKKRNYRLNEKIISEIREFPDKIGLITIDPNFETLIEISPKKSGKPYKAYKYLIKLEEDKISDDLEKLIEFILNFDINQERTNLKDLKISY